MRYYRLPFPRPDLPAHCVPIAYAACAGVRTAAGLARIISGARVARNPALFGTPLLRASGSAPAASVRCTADAWAALAGLRIVETVRPSVEIKTAWRKDAFLEEVLYSRRVGEPTLARFCREHRTGAWVVYSNGHAQAVIRGRLKGWSSARARVRVAYRLEVI